MKLLIQILAATALVFGVANCGSKGGGGKKSAPKAGITGGAQVIVVNANEGDGPIEWSSNYNNIYFNKSTNGNCVYGLSTNADDKNVDEAIQELQNLLKKSTVIKGTGKSFAADENQMPYVEIHTVDSIEVYFLVDKSQVPSSAKVLSNYKDILEYYDGMLTDLKAMGNSGYYCPGKASKN